MKAIAFILVLASCYSSTRYGVYRANKEARACAKSCDGAPSCLELCPGITTVDRCTAKMAFCEEAQSVSPLKTSLAITGGALATFGTVVIVWLAAVAATGSFL